MMIGISKPLIWQQSNALNAQRTNIANFTATAFVSVTTVPVRGAVRMYANEALPTYHVLVSIEAQVSGGVGPQCTLSTLIIKT